MNRIEKFYTWFDELFPQANDQKLNQGLPRVLATILLVAAAIAFSLLIINLYVFSFTEKISDLGTFGDFFGVRIPANVTGHSGDRDRFAHSLHAGESFVR